MSAHALSKGGAGAWLVNLHPRPYAGMRLYCFPYSGAGASAYMGWARRMASFVDLHAINLPGREHRAGELPLIDQDTLVEQLAEAIHAQGDGRPFAFFGHSMGALLAFEVCRELRRRFLPMPTRLLISARPAPHLPSRTEPVSQLPDAEFTELVAALNGTPGEVYTRSSAFAAFIPTLRADFSIIETYHYQPEPPLDIPIAVFGGEQDPVASTAELQAWQVHSTAGCRVRTFSGDHFYLIPAREQLIAELATELQLASEPVGYSG
jgi:medium-chain acyl-[acyl-carrier-protein] hydrolase